MISKRNKELLRSFLKDKHKKNWFRMIIEFSNLYFITKEPPLNYFSCLLYRKNVTNYRDYLSRKENNDLLNWSYSQARGQIKVARNKQLFGDLLVKNDIPTPEILFYNSQEKFTYQNTVYEITDRKSLLNFLKRVFNDLQIERLFCKPAEGGYGRNAFILEKSTANDLSDQKLDLIFSGAYVFQKLIEQHDSLNKINPDSVNTLRIATYKDKGGHVEILTGFIRLGRKGSVVDNASAGGIVVSFDKETGRIRDEGIQFLDKGAGVFYKHPDTGVVFENLQIPYYNQVRELVIKASSLFDLPLMGWDIAITPEGPVIVEVNHDFHLLLSDRMEGGLKNIPSFKKLVEDIK